MNYLKIYKNIVRRAKHRELSCYTERHHIIPKSCGGSNNSYNIVKLTAREHFMTHRLLVKICEKNYGKGHKFTKSMKYALYNFTTRKAHKNADYKITSKTYEKLKIERSDFISEQMKEDYKTGKRVPYWKNKVGPMKGKKHSKESRKKMASLGFKNKKHSKESIEKMIKNNTGKNNPMYGKTYTMDKERKEKIGKANAKYTYNIKFISGNSITINNLNKFAKENNYSLGCIAMVQSGKREKHKDIIGVTKT